MLELNDVVFTILQNKEITLILIEGLTGVGGGIGQVERLAVEIKFTASRQVATKLFQGENLEFARPISGLAD